MPDLHTFRPTDEQLAAIEATDPRLTVQAAAGSGKTSVLVKRYLRHVTDLGDRPDQLLTVTFTRKAAAEMKERIVKALCAMGRFEDAQLAETGPIQTIHSLCERTLRENAFEAGVDPQFEVSSAGEEMLDEAIRECLGASTDDCPEAGLLLKHMAARQQFGAPSSLHSRLAAAVRRPLDKLRSSGISRADLADRYATTESVLAFWRECLLGAVAPEAALAVTDAPDEELGSKLSAEYRRHKLPHEVWMKAFQRGAAQEAAAFTCGLMQLVLAAWDALEGEMERLQVFDFTLLEAKAVRLLRGSELVRRRLRDRYRAVLVDEAQDVNPVQYQLLNSLGLKDEMMVGDPQQSIYAFRQADRKLFMERAAQSASKRLSRNHRSDPGVLRFVDGLFGQLWQGQYQPMLEVQATEEDPFGSDDEGACDGVEYWPQATQDVAATARGVKQLLGEGCRARDIAVLTRTNGFGQQVVEELGRLGVDARIVGGSERFYTRLEVRDLANALEALADPTNDYALLATLRSPFAGLSLDAVALLAKNRPVFQALEGFVSPVSEDQAKLEAFLDWFLPLARYADRLSAWEGLATALRDSPYMEAIATRPNARQTVANVRKLFALAAQDPDMGPPAYAERIREIRQLRHREGDAPAVDEDADAVTVMTIHKAKGLEFDVVVLPETHASLEPKAPDVVVDARRGVVTTKFGPAPSVYHDWLGRLQQTQEREEALRLLYVAMTRAKKRLCIVVDPSRSERKAAGLVWNRMGEKDKAPDGVRVRECGQGA